jgi:hypothetical protein
MTRPTPCPGPRVVDLGDHVIVPAWVVVVLHRAPESGLNAFRRAVRGRNRALDEARKRGACSSCCVT